MTATSVVDLCAAGIVALGVLLAVTRSIDRSILLVAAQSALGASAAIGVGVFLGLGHLVVAGVLAMGAKVVIYPLVLRSMLRASPISVERHAYVGPRWSLVIAIGIILAAGVATSDMALPSSLGGQRALPAAIASMLTGLFLMMSRRKALSLLIGLLVFENGLSLAAFALTYGMPLVVELGVLFDLLIVIVVGWVYARRMLRHFGSLSTDNLRNLRG
ncbi:MAG: NADH-quinone oxidoreductase subunit K [Chloroflexota bacterium]